MVKILIAQPGFNTIELINVRLIFFSDDIFWGRKLYFMNYLKDINGSCFSYNLKLRQKTFYKSVVLLFSFNDFGSSRDPNENFTGGIP